MALRMAVLVDKISKELHWKQTFKKKKTTAGVKIKKKKQPSSFCIYTIECWKEKLYIVSCNIKGVRFHLLFDVRL